MFTLIDNNEMDKMVEMMCKPLEALALCSIGTENTKPDAAAAACPKADTNCRAVVLYSGKAPFSTEALNLAKQSLEEKGANTTTKASPGRITKRHKSNRRAEGFGGITIRHRPGEVPVVEGHDIPRDEVADSILAQQLWETRQGSGHIAAYTLPSLRRRGARGVLHRTHLQASNYLQRTAVVIPERSTPSPTADEEMIDSPPSGRDGNAASVEARTPCGG